MEYPRCKTCRWWLSTSSQGPRTHRICVNSKLGEPLDSCTRDSDGLQYEYDEGGSIATGPDFGCIHHELDQ